MEFIGGHFRALPVNNICQSATLTFRKLKIYVWFGCKWSDKNCSIHLSNGTQQLAALRHEYKITIQTSVNKIKKNKTWPLTKLHAMPLHSSNIHSTFYASTNVVMLLTFDKLDRLTFRLFGFQYQSNIFNKLFHNSESNWHAFQLTRSKNE